MALAGATTVLVRHEAKLTADEAVFQQLARRHYNAIVHIKI